MSEKTYKSFEALQKDSEKGLDKLIEIIRDKSYGETVVKLNKIMSRADVDFNSGVALFASALHRLKNHD